MLPKVILHNAVSADGRVDWFNAEVSRFYELAETWHEDATLAGADTLLHNYPEKKAEPGDAEAFEHETQRQDSRPLLIAPDSRGRLRNIIPLLLHEPYWRGLVILVSRTTPHSYLEFLQNRHLNYISTGTDYVDYKAALEELNSHYSVRTVRVDSGGTLNGILLRAGLVTDISILVHPFLVGGTSPRSIYHAEDLISASGVAQLHLDKVERLPNDLIWLTYSVVKPGP